MAWKSGEHPHPGPLPEYRERRLEPRRRGVVALWVMLAWVACVRGQALELTVDAHQRFQTIEGFGTGLYLNAIRPYDQEWFQGLYARDLGCSIVRMEMTPWVLGKGMSEPVVLGDDLQANIKRMDFVGAGGPSTGRMIRAVNARKLDRMLLIGSPWTPPDWMKQGSEINSNNHNSSGGHLKMDAENLKQFGRYMAAYVKGFEQAYGVPFYAVSLQNELQFTEPYNSCQYTPKEYHEAIKAVGAAFREYGITTKILGPEGVGPDGAYFTGRQMEWIKAVRSDPATAGDLNIFAIHGYGGNGIDILSDGAGLRDYWNKLKDFGLESWMTEASGENAPWLHDDGKGGDDGALSLARHIHEGLVDGNYSAIVYWQCSDGKPSVRQPTLMGDTAASAKDSAKYNCAKQFFRYIRPGAVRVGVTPESATLGASAFVHEGNRTLTVVLVNTGKADEMIRLKLPAGFNAAMQVYRTTATDRFKFQPDVMVKDGGVIIQSPAESVMTLEQQN